ncbi:MAG: hypothetical protein GEV11_23820 [Streptosporangiales bacterium]|nr:hypothetical protein [Streptosporangiales bacterium]
MTETGMRRQVTEPESSGTRPRRRAPLPGPVTIALTTWLLGTAAALTLVAWADSNPFHMNGHLAPLGAGGLLALGAATAAAVLATLNTRYPKVAAVVDRMGGYREVVCAAGAGLFASWMALLLAAALNGTPHGFAGLVGDMGRMVALTTKMADSPWSADGIVGGLPSEYPLLYPLLAGGAANLLGEPAWTIVGRAEVIATSLSMVITYLMWRRLVSPIAALAIAASLLAVFGDPRKPYEVVTLAMLVPWALATFCDPPRGRYRWWAAGIVGGLMVATYQGFLMYAAPGLAVLLVLAVRRGGDLKAALLRYAGVAAVAFAVASFYLVPYLWRTLTQGGGQRVSDLYVANALTENWLPFTEITPIGLLELTGLAGLVLFSGTVWWARPMLVIVIGTYVYRLVGLVSFLTSGHTMFSHYTVKVVGVTLAAAGVLTLMEVGPRLVAFVSRHAVPRRVGAAALVVFLLWTGYRYWEWAMPTGEQRNTAAPIAGGQRTLGTDYATLAHSEPLPFGGLPRFAPETRFRGYFPAGPVVEEVRARLGKDARPTTLSYDERLFSYYPWPGYVPPDRMATNTLARWDDREAELRRLAAVDDPQEFARRSEATRFGRIDVFVLKNQDGAWRFREVAFRPEQFRSSAFDVVHLANATVVAIRIS